VLQRRGLLGRRATLLTAGVAVGLAGALALGPGVLTPDAEGGAAATAGPVVVVVDGSGDVLEKVPLGGGRFAVSYRNSIYGTLAEERYEVGADGRFALVEIAADQLAVLEEYYGVPGAPHRTTGTDRRTWAVDPDPTRPVVFERLSIAATDLGERTLHVPGYPPVALWRLVDENPTVVLDIKENP